MCFSMCFILLRVVGSISSNIVCVCVFVVSRACFKAIFNIC